MPGKLILLIGASSTGKTKWSKTFMKTKRYVARISPEEIMLSSFGTLNLSESEQEAVSLGIDTTIINLLSKDYIVILDTSRLTYRKVLFYYIENYGQMCELHYRLFTETLPNLLNNQSKRIKDKESLVTLEEVKQQFNRVCNLLPELEGLTRSKTMTKIEDRVTYEEEDYHFYG